MSRGLWLSISYGAAMAATSAPILRLILAEPWMFVASTVFGLLTMLGHAYCVDRILAHDRRKLYVYLRSNIKENQ